MTDPALPLARVTPEVWAAYAETRDHQVAEIIDGELHVLPRPGALHARSASGLGMKLGPPFDLGDGGPGGWILLDEPELHLGPRPDVLVPDLAGWRRGRMPELPDVSAFELAPDWVCEVLSERTEATDRGKKRRIYRREGVGHLWLVNPEAQTLEVYRLEGGRWLEVDTYEGAARVRAEPFEALELDLAVLWSR